MKEILLSLCIIIAFLSITGQDFEKIRKSNELKTSFKETNLLEDTLWVMDSSYSYKSYEGELYLLGINKVLRRDEIANRLSSITLSKANFWEPFKNSTLDSLTYFQGTNEVKSEKSYKWRKGFYIVRVIEKNFTTANIKIVVE